MRTKANCFGGQLLQAELEPGVPVFYLSPLAAERYDKAPARGGVPVLFPQFANLGPGRKHGFARNVDWNAVSDQHYQLQVAPGEYDNWLYSAQLDLRWAVASHTLQMIFTVANTGDTSFDWTGGLHPYWLVPDLLQCRLIGLPEEIEWTGQAFEQLFDADATLHLQCGDYALELQTTGFTQWMVWNPGREGTKDLVNMPPQDWQRFVCVEPICASRAVSLQPGETFSGTLTVKRILV